MNDLFDTVQTLRDLGYSVVPSIGKHPSVKWKPYQDRLPTDAEHRSWRYNLRPKPELYGIVTGKLSGIIVVDCDSAAAMLIMGDLKPHVRTPRGDGGHYYFKHPGYYVKSRANLLPKLDIKGDKGFVNAIGTTPNGEYRIEIMPTPEDIYTWNQMPKDILGAMAKGKLVSDEETGAIKALDGVPEGERDVAIYKYACRLFGKGLSKGEVTPLVLLAASRCTPPFPEKEALTKVESASEHERKPTTISLGEPPEIISARALSEMDLPPLKSALPGMVVEGLTIITAKPKAGKGWWVLQTAYSVALGKNLFDGSPCEKGRVLYMGLEDSLRRLQYRVSEINNSTIFAKVSRGKGGLHINAQLGEIPDGLDLTIRWPKIDEGCLEYLEKYLDEHPGTHLIVIDIFKRIAKAKKGKGSTYEEDYESIQPIQELATRRRVAVIVVHHNRKAGAEDPIDMVSGTFGLTGGVDNVIVIQRVTRGETHDESKFSFVGRDIDERELAMKFDKTSHMWSLIGDADTHFVSDTRKVILEYLEDDGMLPSKLAKLMGRKVSTIQNLLLKMLRDGQVDKDSKGRYTASGFKMDDRLFRKERD